ncbi:hypothetical protein SCP_0901810 [Sparassis crispa]|uniref:Uncharacterized protein n=1 Tax=Sparassis crispa TaxID=139825 RepID=A0A401GVU4_9APHY|nr:hypothetical protein SCP_0901810 [Sparassis crispa]GBE86302.1 hypothetical protein SCP_0901810 [Sparassis crispa]
MLYCPQEWSVVDSQHYFSVIKSCLKQCVASAPQNPGVLESEVPLSASGPEDDSQWKCVSFCTEGEEQIFYAYEWDRTPIPVDKRPKHRSAFSVIFPTDCINPCVDLTQEAV